MFTIIAHNSVEYLQTVALRDEVLRRPLGLHFAEEQLAEESADIHIAGYVSAELVACAILTPITLHKVKMRQVAVLPGIQGQGVGRKLVEFCEALAQQMGCTEIELHAREAVVSFYEKSGYSVTGEQFTEVSIPHLAMIKIL